MTEDIVESLLHDESELTDDRVEAIVAGILADAGVWASPRTSDGVKSWRVVERSPARLRICGHIWEIDQSLCAFWLDVTSASPEPGWTLYYAIDDAAIGARRARNALDAIREPTDVPWRTVVSSET